VENATGIGAIGIRIVLSSCHQQGAYIALLHQGPVVFLRLLAEARYDIGSLQLPLLWGGMFGDGLKVTLIRGIGVSIVPARDKHTSQVGSPCAGGAVARRWHGEAAPWYAGALVIRGPELIPI
jgi:hypothetical protein